MPPRPPANEGIIAFEEWEKELFKRRKEYNKKNDQNPNFIEDVKEEDVKEEIPIQLQNQPLEVDKKKLHIYVKLMSGDIIPLDVNSSSKISTIKEILKTELLINNIKNIILFDNDGNYLIDDYIINKKLKQNDVINVLINISDEPPFKGENWIKLRYSKTIELKDNKKQTKKMNPTKRFYDFNTRNYEGNLDDFLNLPGVTNIVLLNEVNRDMLNIPNLSYNQQRNLRLFRESIEELQYDNLKYVYGVYNIYHNDNDKKTEFIATNEDSSIVYELTGGIVFVYINGFKMFLEQWMAMKRDKRLMFLNFR